MQKKVNKTQVPNLKPQIPKEETPREELGICDLVLGTLDLEL